MSDEYGMSINDFHTERASLTHNAGTVLLKRRRVDMPVEIRANIIIAAENLREAMKTTEQSETFRFVLRALTALDKELSR